VVGFATLHPPYNSVFARSLPEADDKAIPVAGYRGEVPAASQGDDLIFQPDDKQPQKSPILNLTSYTNVKHGLV